MLITEGNNHTFLTLPLPQKPSGTLSAQLSSNRIDGTEKKRKSWSQLYYIIFLLYTSRSLRFLICKTGVAFLKDKVVNREMKLKIRKEEGKGHLVTLNELVIIRPRCIKFQGRERTE